MICYIVKSHYMNHQKLQISKRKAAFKTQNLIDKNIIALYHTINHGKY